MEGIKYKNSHAIPEDVIVNMLNSIGCKDIKNRDYKGMHEGRSYSSKVPDFSCKYKGKETAVEVGTLTKDYTEYTKIQSLLNDYEYVIHIFADKHYYLLHCVLYQRNHVIAKKVLETLRNQSNYIQNLLNELEKDVE
jgi:hypothetical protein